jgi:DNA polymerase-3 subunit beta
MDAASKIASPAPKKPRAPKAKVPRKAKLSSVPVDAKPIPADPDAALQCMVPIAELRKAICRMSTIVDMKSSMPMLHHVMVAADGNAITITATDQNLSLTMTIAQDHYHSGSGAVAIECRRLRDLLKALPDSIATIDANKLASQTRVFVDDCTARLFSLPTRDFPKTPQRTADWHTIDAGVLRAMLEETIPTVCHDETRFHLNGVFVESCDGESIVAVSTDGHRLTKTKRMMASSFQTRASGSVGGIVIPEKAVRELVRNLSDGSCQVAMQWPYLFVQQDNWTLAIKLIDCQYPPYQQVIPQDHKLLVTCDRRKLIDACKRAKVLCSDTRGLRMKVDAGALVIESDDPDVGELRERVPADYNKASTNIVVGANTEYLRTALEQMSDDSCVLGISNELDPISVRGLDDAAMRSVDDAEFMAIIMPMRV